MTNTPGLIESPPGGLISVTDPATPVPLLSREMIDACPERVRVYIMGLERCAEEYEKARMRASGILEAIVKAHMSGLPENTEFSDPVVSCNLLAMECARLRDQFMAVLGPELLKCMEYQDAKHGGPAHDDTHMTNTRPSAEVFKENLIHVATLCVRAIQSQGRKLDGRIADAGTTSA